MQREGGTAAAQPAAAGKGAGDRPTGGAPAERGAPGAAAPRWKGTPSKQHLFFQIGRASCRERV